jgi:hypothetical protein
MMAIVKTGADADIWRLVSTPVDRPTRHDDHTTAPIDAPPAKTVSIRAIDRAEFHQTVTHAEPVPCLSRATLPVREPRSTKPGATPSTSPQ